MHTFCSQNKQENLV